jgi:hypothetical protein
LTLEHDSLTLEHDSLTLEHDSSTLAILGQQAASARSHLFHGSPGPARGRRVSGTSCIRKRKKLKPGFHFYIGFQGLIETGRFQAVGQAMGQLLDSGCTAPCRGRRRRGDELARHVPVRSVSGASCAFGKQQNREKPRYHLIGSRVVKPGAFERMGFIASRG